MVYNTFLETLESRLQILLTGQAHVTLRQIPKNNGVLLDSLCISCPGSLVSPVIYLKEYYDQYQSGIPIDTIISDILSVYQKNSLPDDSHFRKFSSRSHAKHHLVYKLISTEANLALLSQIPHIPFLDLSIVFYLFFDDGTTCFSSLVYHDHLKEWQMTKEELFPLALKNSQKLLPSTIRNMADVVRQMASSEIDHLEEELIEDDTLYILTNTSEFHGAGCLLYPGQLKSFADSLESDLIVLPSSIHEVLLTPDRDFLRYHVLNEMVSQINEEEVLTEDRLSNHIYLYSRKDDRLHIPAVASASLPISCFQPNNRLPI